MYILGLVGRRSTGNHSCRLLKGQKVVLSGPRGHKHHPLLDLLISCWNLHVARVDDAVAWFALGVLEVLSSTVVLYSTVYLKC